MLFMRLNITSATNSSFSLKNLAVFIDVVFEVIVFGDDGFVDERLVDDANCWQEGGAAGFSKPRDLSGLFVVLVVQVEARLHGDKLPISPPEELGEKSQNLPAFFPN